MEMMPAVNDRAGAVTVATRSSTRPCIPLFHEKSLLCILMRLYLQYVLSLIVDEKTGKRLRDMGESVHLISARDESRVHALDGEQEKG